MYRPIKGIWPISPKSQKKENGYPEIDKISYISVNICNELIDLMAQSILLKIVIKIKCGKYFPIILDSTSDLSHIDQVRKRP